MESPAAQRVVCTQREPACEPGGTCRASSNASDPRPAVARSPTDPRLPGKRNYCKRFAPEACQPPGQPQLLVSTVQHGAPRSATGLGGSRRLSLAHAGHTAPPSASSPALPADTPVAALAPAADGSCAATSHPSGIFGRAIAAGVFIVPGPCRHGHPLGSVPALVALLAFYTFHASWSGGL